MLLWHTIAAWILVYGIIAKGLHSSGKYQQYSNMGVSWNTKSIYLFVKE